MRESGHNFGKLPDRSSRRVPPDSIDNRKKHGGNHRSGSRQAPAGSHDRDRSAATRRLEKGGPKAPIPVKIRQADLFDPFILLERPVNSHMLNEHVHEISHHTKYDGIDIAVVEDFTDHFDEYCEALNETIRWDHKLADVDAQAMITTHINIAANINSNIQGIITSSERKMGHRLFNSDGTISSEACYGFTRNLCRERLDEGSDKGRPVLTKIRGDMWKWTTDYKRVIAPTIARLTTQEGMLPDSGEEYEAWEEKPSAKGKEVPRYAPQYYEIPIESNVPRRSHPPMSGDHQPGGTAAGRRIRVTGHGFGVSGAPGPSHQFPPQADDYAPQLQSNHFGGNPQVHFDPENPDFIPPQGFAAMPQIKTRPKAWEPTQEEQFFLLGNAHSEETLSDELLLNSKAVFARESTQLSLMREFCHQVRRVAEDVKTCSVNPNAVDRHNTGWMYIYDAQNILKAGEVAVGANNQVVKGHSPEAHRLTEHLVRNDGAKLEKFIKDTTTWLPPPPKNEVDWEPDVRYRSPSRGRSHARSQSRSPSRTRYQSPAPATESQQTEERGRTRSRGQPVDFDDEKRFNLLAESHTAPEVKDVLTKYVKRFFEGHDTRKKTIEKFCVTLVELAEVRRKCHMSIRLAQQTAPNSSNAESIWQKLQDYSDAADGHINKVNQLFEGGDKFAGVRQYSGGRVAGSESRCHQPFIDYLTSGHGRKRTQKVTEAMEHWMTKKEKGYNSHIRLVQTRYNEMLQQGGTR